MGAHAQAYASGAAESFAALRAHLAASRRAGLDFEQAWGCAATEGVLPPAGADRDVLEASRSAWRRGYLREPPAPAEAALSRLVDVLSAEADPELGRREVLT